MYIFKPKIPIWVKKFGMPWNGKGWYINLATLVYRSLCIKEKKDALKKR
jgi:hypothetical protein